MNMNPTPETSAIKGFLAETNKRQDALERRVRRLQWIVWVLWFAIVLLLIMVFSLHWGG